MDKNLKEKWVTALRSGEYKQGKKVLRDENDYFCCLGVLCDLIDNTKWENKLCKEFYHYDKQSSFLSEKIMLKYLNIDINKKEDYKKTVFLWNLAYMNDNGNTFNEIAYEIEKEL